MAKTDSEILTISRIKRLLEGHSRPERERIANWIAAFSADVSAPQGSPAPDGRQLQFPIGAAAQ